MATRLQKLLGLAPLESLRNRASRDMQMERPINNYFGEPQSPEVLSPLNIPSPTQGFFTNQMQNMGLQSPSDVYTFDPDQSGNDPGGGGVIDPPEGTGTTETTATNPARDSVLLQNFLAGLGETKGNQLFSFLENDNTLDMDELLEIAGFDIDALKLSKNEVEYRRITEALQSQFSRFRNQFEEIPGQLSNLQQLRGDLFGQELTDASGAYGNLMDFVQQGSVSGLEMGQTESQAQQATQNLENALKQQLIGAEGQYLNELDSLLQSTAGNLYTDLGEAAASYISENTDLAQFLNPDPEAAPPGTWNRDAAYKMAEQMLNPGDLIEAMAYYDAFPNQTQQQWEDYLDDEYGEGSAYD